MDKLQENYSPRELWLANKLEESVKEIAILKGMEDPIILTAKGWLYILDQELPRELYDN